MGERAIQPPRHWSIIVSTDVYGWSQSRGAIQSGMRILAVNHASWPVFVEFG